MQHFQSSLVLSLASSPSNFRRLIATATLTDAFTFRLDSIILNIWKVGAAIATLEVLRTSSAVSALSSSDLGNFLGNHFTAAPIASITRSTLNTEKIVITRHEHEKKKRKTNLFGSQRGILLFAEILKQHKITGELTDSSAAEECSIVLLSHMCSEAKSREKPQINSCV